MVNAAAVAQANARFAEERNSGLVCVFAGATSGIGASTLEKLIVMLEASTFYVIGRSASRFANQREKLEALNPSCKLVFLEAEVSLLADVDDVCKKIAAAEKKVDYLYMSPGSVPLNGPQYTKEGLETCFVISYYARMRLLTNLLPLLRQSPRARVLSVLNAGKEAALREEDIGLEQHWSVTAVINHTTTMMSLALEYLAEKDKRITFLHAFPGLVDTDIFAKLTAPESSGLAWRAALAVIRGIMALVMRTIAISVGESGERQAFHLITDTYGPGAWRVDHLGEQITAAGVLGQYRERGWTGKVWEHTVGIFEKVSVGQM